mmetsp:Transcript_22888/g.54329  ORF Transcript_22888/g.54329 Transcript_22888/m.54329 type:complete len:212 (+) Transcript_22888:1014-1649(+)
MPSTRCTARRYGRNSSGCPSGRKLRRRRAMEKPAGRRKRAGVMRERRRQRTRTTAAQRQLHCMSAAGSPENSGEGAARRGMGREPVVSRKKLGVGFRFCACRSAPPAPAPSRDGIRSHPPLHSTGSRNLSWRTESAGATEEEKTREPAARAMASERRRSEGGRKKPVRSEPHAAELSRNPHRSCSSSPRRPIPYAGSALRTKPEEEALKRM